MINIVKVTPLKGQCYQESKPLQWCMRHFDSWWMVLDATTGRPVDMFCQFNPDDDYSVFTKDVCLKKMQKRKDFKVSTDTIRNETDFANMLFKHDGKRYRYFIKRPTGEIKEV